MNREELLRAAELDRKLREWEQALQRSGNSSFKSATLIVTEQAHGSAGVDNRPQQAESRLLLSREEVELFLRHSIDRLSADLARILRD